MTSQDGAAPKAKKRAGSTAEGAGGGGGGGAGGGPPPGKKGKGAGNPYDVSVPWACRCR